MKSWLTGMKSTKWTHGIFHGEIIISDTLPPDYMLVGWTRSPWNAYLLLTVQVNLGIWKPSVKLAYWFQKTKSE